MARESLFCALPPAFLPCCVYRAIEKLSGRQFENYSFKISYIPDEEVSSPSPPHRAREPGHGPGSSPQARQIDFPLRILVPTQFVGAIIGKEGLTIKNITKQTQSRYVPPGFPLLTSEGLSASRLGRPRVTSCCSGRLCHVEQTHVRLGAVMSLHANDATIIP